ncbi:MAG: hypothetical protein ACT4OT_10120 [Acidobacteriota bacterium]
MADYEEEYNKLYKEVQEANADKKRRLVNIKGQVGKLMDIVCEPIPPGCDGPDPSGTLVELAEACRNWNTKKKKALTTISKDIETLFQKICDPVPPGCGSI